MPHRLAHSLVTALLAVCLPAQNYYAADDAIADPALSNQNNGFLAVPGIADDFVRAGGGQFVELPNGTARLTGRVFSQGNLYSAFLFDVQLSGRVDPGAPSYPPAGAPNLGLLASAYVPNGGVDPGTFAYYTNCAATLTGVRNLAGAVVTLTSVAPVQLGNGANNKNGALGLFGEFAVTVAQQPNFGTLTPTANASWSLDFVAPFDEWTSHPQVYDPALTPLTDGRAFVLPGVGDDYVFVPAAPFREQATGQATLTGTIARLSDLTDSWQLQLTWSGRVDPGQANHPPAGGPSLQLQPTAYVNGGGTIDPNHWHYYAIASGTLTGSGINAGGQIDLVQSGPTQVGGGANQTNTYFGCYAALAPTIVNQPTARTLAITGDAELSTLNAVFPVLPFPSLTVPPSQPTHPTVTDQGLLLQGHNLAWIELVSIDFDLLAPGQPNNFVNGWFRIVDNDRIEIHARPEAPPGVHNVRVLNPAVQSNAVAVDFVEPTTPALYAEPTVGAYGAVHLRLHHGQVVGPAVSLVALSQTLAPSAAPGVVSLDIGAAFSDLTVDPTVYGHDPLNHVAAIDYQPIVPALLGNTFYFQGVVLDVGAFAPPFAATNYWQVEFQ